MNNISEGKFGEISKHVNYDLNLKTPFEWPLLLGDNIIVLDIMDILEATILLGLSLL